uniref:Putative KilA-N domain-containing protein n=1 Tax=Moumouvirus sp. 'Monve' TaxID=1128131 RepID=H2EG19_9VIRU|nr:putative KilA-N domain-containing protein [Moumouvirus Monve]
MTRTKITECDIRKTCFEEINKNYSWGIYYNKNVIVMKKNGYVNATKFIASIGRDEDVGQWLADDYGLELLDALSNEVGLHKNKLTTNIESKSNPDLDGIYVHQDILAIMTMMIDPVFCYRASKIINKKLYNQN